MARDLKLEVEVRVVVKPTNPTLGQEGVGPAERSMNIVKSKESVVYVGETADLTTMVANAMKAVTRKWQMLVAQPPECRTAPASSIAAITATLNGSVHPHGVSGTTIEFLWGTTRDPATSQAVVSGSPSALDAWTAFTGSLTGLTTKTRYFYRIKSVGTGGTILGPLQSFVTA